MKDEDLVYAYKYYHFQTKFTKLQVPESLLLSIKDLTAQVDTLKQQEHQLKQRADDITLARDALQKLRRI